MSGLRLFSDVFESQNSLQKAISDYHCCLNKLLEWRNDSELQRELRRLETQILNLDTQKHSPSKEIKSIFEEALQTGTYKKPYAAVMERVTDKHEDLQVIHISQSCEYIRTNFTDVVFNAEFGSKIGRRHAKVKMFLMLNLMPSDIYEELKSTRKSERARKSVVDPNFLYSNTLQRRKKAKEMERRQLRNQRVLTRSSSTSNLQELATNQSAELIQEIATEDITDALLSDPRVFCCAICHKLFTYSRADAIATPRWCNVCERDAACGDGEPRTEQHKSSQPTATSQPTSSNTTTTDDVGGTVPGTVSQRQPVTQPTRLLTTACRKRRLRSGLATPTELPPVVMSASAPATAAAPSTRDNVTETTRTRRSVRQNSVDDTIEHNFQSKQIKIR